MTTAAELRETAEAIEATFVSCAAVSVARSLKPLRVGAILPTAPTDWALIQMFTTSAGFTDIYFPRRDGLFRQLRERNVQSLDIEAGMGLLPAMMRVFALSTDASARSPPVPPGGRPTVYWLAPYAWRRRSPPRSSPESSHFVQRSGALTERTGVWTKYLPQRSGSVAHCSNVIAPTTSDNLVMIQFTIEGGGSNMAVDIVETFKNLRDSYFRLLDTPFGLADRS